MRWVELLEHRRGTAAHKFQRWPSKLDSFSACRAITRPAHQGAAQHMGAHHYLILLIRIHLLLALLLAFIPPFITLLRVGVDVHLV